MTIRDSVIFINKCYSKVECYPTYIIARTSRIDAIKQDTIIFNILKDTQ